LAILTLPLPFVWLEIGPLGKQYYGQNVPDIYILGATILGKDRSFWGINFAYKFQLLAILFYAAMNLLSAKVIDKRKTALILTTITLLLLLLFPFWLYLYVVGVIHNSDGAAEDLKIHYSIGLLLYVILIIINYQTFKSLINASS
jgi:hypothetical protein